MPLLKKKQSGFSMIEVLASLVVIGVGMLGLTGLQLMSMKSTNNAHSRNIASMLAFELGDRMRANPEGVENGSYDNTNGLVSCDTQVSFCRGDTSCTATELAKFDIKEILCGMSKDQNDQTTTNGGVKNLLVGGQLLIEDNTGCPKITTSNKSRITVSWSESRIDERQTEIAQSKNVRICTRL